MKMLSIGSIIFALLSLLGFLVNFAINNVESLSDRWEENWHNNLHMVTWFMNDAGAGIAILLAAIGLFLNSRNAPQPSALPVIR